MPVFVVTDWANGPMGPGFFILFRAHVDVFYDGGPMHHLIDRPKDKGKLEERFGELFALIMLMREQK